MRIIVSDASVLFDLAEADLLLRCFRLPYEFQIADVMFEEELLSLEPRTLDALVEAGLVVARFEGEEVLEAVRLRQRYRALSAPDAFALLLARRERAILLTGDRRLRNAATTEGLERHGHLWMIEQLSDQTIVADSVLVRVLQTWKKDPRVRLPGDEIDALRARLAPDRGDET